MVRFSRYLLLVAASLCLVAQSRPVPVRAQSSVKFTCIPGFFPSQPDNQPIGPAHGGAAVDHAGDVFVSTDSPRGILVFDPDGHYLMNFGPSMIHGLFIQNEKDGEYLYCALPSQHEVMKIRTDGTVMWEMGYPEESKIYSKPDEFNPTNMVALPDGTIFVADGYGKNWIHKYDKNCRWIKSFGGPGGMPAADGKFNRCHGLAVDLRGPKPLLVVCNRESGRVEHWDTDGNLVKVLQRGLRMPAAVQVTGDYIAVAELQGRVTILGKDNSIVAEIGDNPKPEQRAAYGLAPAQWTVGICNSPHGLTFDHSGNVIVSEWSQFGRIQKFAVQH